MVRQLESYTHSTYYEREKIVYLNKEGRQLIGSSREIKKSPLIAHTLLRNEVYIYFGCPVDWRMEHTLASEQITLSSFQIKIEGLSLKGQKKVIADAVFNRNGYFNIVEIDNTRNMVDNKKKIELYREILPGFQVPKLWFFTTFRGSEEEVGEVDAGVKKSGENF